MAVFVWGNVVLCGFSRPVPITTLTRLSQPHLHTSPTDHPKLCPPPRAAVPLTLSAPPPHALSITLGPALLVLRPGRCPGDPRCIPTPIPHPIHPPHSAQPCLAVCLAPCLAPLRGYLFHSCQRFTFLPSPRKLPNCTISQTRGLSGSWGAMDYPLGSQAHHRPTCGSTTAFRGPWDTRPAPPPCLGIAGDAMGLNGP